MRDTQEEVFVEPIKVWREWYKKSDSQWREAITEVMAEEGMAERFGESFQEWLHAQHMLTEVVGQQLASFNLPSRADVLSIGDRLSVIEDNLSVLSADINRLSKGVALMVAAQRTVAVPATASPTKKPVKTVRRNQQVRSK